MNIAITGTGGFIGSNILRTFGKKYICSAFDFKSDSNSPFLLLDEMNKGRSFDLVIHLGANSNAQTSRFSSIALENSIYSDALALLCARKNIPLIFASSFAVYGNGTSAKTLSPYAESKLRTERFIDSLQSDFPGWKFACLRFTNIFGENESHKGAMKSIPIRFIEEAKLFGEIEVWVNENGGIRESARRDFLWVEDLVRNLESFIVHDLWAHEIMDFGSGISMTTLGVAELIRGYIPCKIKLVNIPEYVDRGNYQMFTQANLSRLKTLIPDFRTTPAVQSIQTLCEMV